MGRKRLYHTEEDKAEAKRRHHMDWYDRNRSKVLKDYKMRKASEGKDVVKTSTSRLKPLVKSVAYDSPKSARPARNHVVSSTSFDETLTRSRTVELNHDEVAPQILLGRVHRQNRLLSEFMQTSSESFCVRVAEEVAHTPKDHQLDCVRKYMESVASLIDSARPHTMALYNKYGMIPEWREVKRIQNGMGVIIQYLDEIHHHAEIEDLSAALALSLLSFQ